MTDPRMKIPGPDHPISIVRNPSRIIVRVDGRPIANTVEALTLYEAGRPPVHYIPRVDIDMARLTPTRDATFCAYKGRAGYFTVASDGEPRVNAAWSYPHPFEAVAAIADHIAFYPDRVDAIETWEVGAVQ